MVISAIYRILALFMAALMLTISVSFSMNMHSCQGNIESISLFGKAKSCCENEDRDRCNKILVQCDHSAGQSQSWSQKPCCIDTTIVFENLTYQAVYNVHGNERPITPKLYNSIAFDASKLRLLSSHGFLGFHPHKPPLPDQDIHILFQSFLN